MLATMDFFLILQVFIVVWVECLFQISSCGIYHGISFSYKCTYAIIIW